MSLEKSMGLGNLIFYGTGTILGAGIFVVIGEVLLEAGPYAPIAYAVAGLVAVFTALSFAEIAARVPTAGGAIDYTEAAFPDTPLPEISGWLLIIANLVSGATITTGFVSYLNSFVSVPGWMATVGLILGLGGIAIAGMKQSAWFMTITTLIGVVTLLAILWVTRDSLLAWPDVAFSGEGGDRSSSGTFIGIFAGAFLAIYSFIGFGDVAQTAEEVKDVRKTLPRAMIIVLIVVFFFYLAVAAALAGRSDVQELAKAKAPLVEAASTRGLPALPVAIASLFVITNGALTQIVAASRLLMDIGRDGRTGAPEWLGRVNETTNTPIIATIISLAIVLAMALFVPLKTLASATSLAILLVFVAVNAALWKLKKRDQPEEVPNMWKLVPILGVVFCSLTVIGQIILWVVA